MAQRLKLPVNYRATPSHAAESFDVSGGFALIAEAPADPTSAATPLAVTVNGQARARVTGAPGLGEYRVLTQSVIGADGQPHAEYLPVLQLNAADEGLAGSADYYRTGTILTAEWYAALLAFVTPLVVAAETDLPVATFDATLRGRAGDQAFVGGAIYFSDGFAWNKAGAAVGAAASMVGSVAGTRAVLSADLTTLVTLAAAVTGSSSVAGTFQTVVQFVGAIVAGPATAIGALTTAIQIAGAITAAASEAGALTTAIQMAGAIAGSASGATAALTTGAGDTTAPDSPVLTVPSTATSMALTGVALSAHDAVGVTAYFVKDVAGGAAAPSAPLAADVGWVSVTSAVNYSTSSATYTVGGMGARDSYAWFKDAAGNVSARSSVSTVTVSAGAPLVPANPGFERNSVQMGEGGGTAWASGTTYAANVYISYGGRYYWSLQASNVGHQPDTSPTWWERCWWRNASAGVVGSLASAEMTGSRVGQVQAAGYDPEYAVAGDAQLLYRFLAAELAAGNVITFDLRVKNASGTVAYIDVDARDSGGSQINSNANGKERLILFGAVGTNNSSALRIASPVASTTYAGKTFDVQAFVTASLNAGKTWANVDSVVIKFGAYDDVGGGVEFYVDNFR